jgi:uncharacterized caspase-like protein
MTSQENRAARMARAAWLLLAGVAALSVHPYALAETRVALIIGNSTYEKPDMRLPNPANDAAAIARVLKADGFETIVKLNVKRSEFYHAVDEFGSKISRDPHAVGLFYYAGHAVQADGVNYLIPVDADIQAQTDLEPNAFDVSRVLRSMKGAQNEMNIIILDACRNNPLPKTRGMDRGLARMEAPSGTFIAYAAGPGQTAQDGAPGTNGVFTGEVIKAMSEPGLQVEQVFKKVIVGVKADTKGAQTPWMETSLQGDFYFLPKTAGAAATTGAAAAAAAATPNAPSAGLHVDNASELEQAYWDRIKDSADPADFKDYKTQYPNGAHAAEAALLMRKLNRTTASNAANTTPAAPQAPAAATRAVTSTPPVSTPPAGAARSPVEPGVQGMWTMKVPSPQGISTCYWDVKSSGSYTAWCVGAAPLSHAGTVSVADGRWTLNATTTNYTDGGTYLFSNPNTLVMTGKLGTAAWLRSK